MYKIILFGLLVGMLWYRLGERFDQSKLKPKCWELLHYYNKESFPLYIVHLKSIITGIILIYMGCSNYKYKNEVIIFLGSAIIGLHLYQGKNEYYLIKSQGLEYFSLYKATNQATTK
jgi:hypothetical protein